MRKRSTAEEKPFKKDKSEKAECVILPFYRNVLAQMREHGIFEEL